MLQEKRINLMPSNRSFIIDLLSEYLWLLNKVCHHHYYHYYHHYDANKGTDASVNKELSRALKEAKDNKLPKENIERAISKAQGKEASDITSGIYEGINTTTSLLILLLPLPPLLLPSLTLTLLFVKVFGHSSTGMIITTCQ